MIPVKPAKDLQKGEVFRRDSGGYFTVLEEPVQVDGDDAGQKPDYLVHLLNDRGVRSYWKVYDFMDVRVIDQESIEKIEYVQLHIGGSILRFIDSTSLEADWGLVLDRGYLHDGTAVHEGKVLEIDGSTPSACVRISQIKAVTFGRITREKGVA